MFFKGMQWTVLELTEFNKSASEIKENKDRWAFLLKNGPYISNMSDSDKMFLMCDPVIRDAYARLDMSTWTEQDRLIYEDIEDKRKVAAGVSREDRKKGEQIGIEKGIEIGRELERKKFEEENKKNTIAIIRMMLESGANDEFIKKVVNANGKYTDSDLDNMINCAKEEIQQPAAKKIRHG